MWSRRDVLGIVVALVGTVVLAVLAATAAASSPAAVDDHGKSQLGAAAVAMLLLATGFTLVNLGHVVGLFLVRRVSFQRWASRLFARLSLLGTPIAILVSVALLATR